MLVMIPLGVLFLLISTSVLLSALPEQQKLSRRPSINSYKNEIPKGLTLPHNATAIRASIVDTFSCENKIYGFYADMENDCQIFHVCLPYKSHFIRWSFICPAETVFNQETFVCTRKNYSIPCKESIKYYALNAEIGKDDNDIILDDPVDTSLTRNPFLRPLQTNWNNNRRMKNTLL